MIHPPFSINHFSCQHFSGLDTIFYSPFTILPQLIVPPLFREQLSNTFDDAYFIVDAVATPIVPHKTLINTCSYKILSQAQNILSGFLFASHRSLFITCPTVVSCGGTCSLPYSSYSIVEHSLLTQNKYEELHSDYSFREKIEIESLCLSALSF